MAMLPLHRNQSIDFYFKSVDWFLYERDIAMKKAKSKNIALKWQLKVNVRVLGPFFELTIL